MVQKMRIQALVGACLFAGALGCTQVPSSTSPTAALTGDSSTQAPGVGTSSAERRVLAEDQLDDLDQARAAMPERVSEADADKLLVDLGDVQVDESQTYDVQASKSSNRSSAPSRSSHRSSSKARIHRGMDRQFRDNFRHFRYFRYNNFYFPYYLNAGYYVPYIYPYTYTNTFGYASPYASPFLYDQGQGGLYSPYSYVYGNVAPVTNTVIVSDFTFAPAVVRVPVGSTVTWQFNGPSPHTTTSATNVLTSVRWDSGIQRAGQTYSVRFDQPGSFDYFCKLHPAMRGTVIVN